MEQWMKWSLQGCESLMEMNISEGIGRIDQFSFYGCKITEVTVHEGVKSIAYTRFGFCDKLRIIINASSVLK